MPSAKQPRHTSDDDQQRAESEACASVHEREEAVDGARRQVVESAVAAGVAGAVVVRHDVRSVPRQTDGVTPDPTVIDDSARDHVIVEGPDALDVSPVPGRAGPPRPGGRRPRWTLVLEPTGRSSRSPGCPVSADDRFEFDIDAGFGEALAARLERFKIRVKADIARRVRRRTRRPSASPRGGARRRWVAADGLRDRAGRDDSRGDRGGAAWR